MSDILDGNITVDSLPKNLNYYVTHIQLDEIKNSRDDRKKELLKIFSAIKKEEVLTESAVAGVSKVGQSKVSNGNLYGNLLSRLREFDKKAGKRKIIENQVRDALIVDTSIKNNLILVSDDANLRAVAQEFGGQTLSFGQFRNNEFLRI